MPRESLRSRRYYPHRHLIGTRWSDNDVYGHVNNALYYHWFDTVVNGWLIGNALLDPGGGDPIALVVETSCRYARPVSFPAPIEIGLALDRLGSSSVVYRLGVFEHGTDEAAAEGLFTHVAVGRANRRPVPLPAIWRERMAALAPLPA